MTTTAYAADRTALLIVDPYNDFMSEGGKLYEATRETAEAVGFYDNMRRLIPAIRAARIQVVIVPHHRWREGDYEGWKHMNPSQVRTNRAQGFAAGSWGGEFHPKFGPQDGDVVVLPGSITEPDVAKGIREFYEQFAIPAESFARAVAFAISQPEEVDVNEILFQPTRQEL